MCGMGAVWTCHSTLLSLATASDMNTITFPLYREGSRRRKRQVRPDNKGAHSHACYTLLGGRTRECVREEFAMRAAVCLTFYLKLEESCLQNDWTSVSQITLLRCSNSFGSY